MNAKSQKSRVSGSGYKNSENSGIFRDSLKMLEIFANPRDWGFFAFGILIPGIRGFFEYRNFNRRDAESFNL